MFPKNETGLIELILFLLLYFQMGNCVNKARSPNPQSSWQPEQKLCKLAGAPHHCSNGNEILNYQTAPELIAPIIQPIEIEN